MNTKESNMPGMPTPSREQLSRATGRGSAFNDLGMPNPDYDPDKKTDNSTKLERSVERAKDLGLEKQLGVVAKVVVDALANMSEEQRRREEFREEYGYYPPTKQY